MTADAGHLHLDGIPFPLAASPGSGWRISEGAAEIVSGPGTDYFVDPGYTDVPDEYTRLNADTLLGEVPAGDFQLVARVEADLRATYDAGVLLLRQGDRQWAKLCLEYSPSGQPMIVSVVTRDVSDDANALTLPSATSWLRIARKGPVIAFHASPDGQHWAMIRVFVLGAATTPTWVGLLAQSPSGDGCRVRFGDAHYLPHATESIRDGG